MKKHWNLTILITFLGSIAMAQVQGNPLAVSAGTATIARPAAEGFEAVLSKTLDCKKSKVGDLVLARILDEVQLKGGAQIPKNAKLIGHISEVQVKGRGGPDSRVGIVFEKALLSDGKEFPLQLSIQSITAANEAGAPPGVTGGQPSGNETSKGILIESNSNGGSRTTLLRSNEDNVRVESGAHLLLRVMEQ